jgi:hypothetical protein
LNKGNLKSKIKRDAFVKFLGVKEEKRGQSFYKRADGFGRPVEPGELTG